MCLSTKYKKKSGRKTGYKLLYRTHDDSGDLETGQCGAGRVVISRKSFTTDPKSDTSLTRPIYPMGFHIFLSRKSAERVRMETGASTVLCKVRFKDEVAYGKVRWHCHQPFCSVVFHTSAVVARKCKIIEVIT